jgi:hypothetical protein
MVNLNNLIVCLLFSALALNYSCSGRVVPRVYKYKESHFSIKEQALISKIELDTSAIYIHEWEGMREYGKVKLFNVMKFYSDGRFQFTTFENVDQFGKLQTPPDEAIHYYKIENNVLKLEVYVNSMVGFDYWEGNMSKDSLVFLKINKRKEHLVYKKIR